MEQTGVHRAILVLLLTLAFCLPSQAAIALVTGTNQCLANATSSSLGPIDMTGATLIVAVITDYSGQGPSVLTDNQTNTYIALTARIQGTPRNRMLYVENPTISATQTFSIDGTNSYVVLCVAGFSGTATSSVKDQDAGNIGTASTISTTSITPAEDNELVVAGLSTSVASSTVDAAYTEITDSNYSPFFSAAMAYQIQTSAAATDATFTVGSGAENAATIASFKSSGSAPACTPRLTLLGAGSC